MISNRLTMIVAAVLATLTSAGTLWAASSEQAFDAQVRAAAATVAAAAVKARASSHAALKRAETGKAISDVEGLYRRELKKNGRVLVADSLQIVAAGDGGVYFKVERQSYEGGHANCELSGIAERQNGRFVFTDQNAPGMRGERCRLELRPGSTGIEVVDNDSCQDYCGIALTLPHATFSYRSRRPIADIEQLKRSEDYRNAVKEFSK